MTGWETEHVYDTPDHADAHAELTEPVAVPEPDRAEPDEEPPAQFRNYASRPARPRYPDAH